MGWPRFRLGVSSQAIVCQCVAISHIFSMKSSDLIFPKFKPRKVLTVVVHWPRLGPYHIARLKATEQVFSQHRFRINVLEIYRSDNEYLWESIDQGDEFERSTLFPEATSREISRLLLFKKIWGWLETIQPYAVAINGYSSWDSLFILLWCHINNCVPILMSESKLDDAHRMIVKEYIKKKIVSQFNAALCGGTPHRAYLKQLGMPENRIYDGYDAVDNQFFIEETDKVRQSSRDFHALPGLQDTRPFFLASGRFIPRKNFIGLIRAYKLYKQNCQRNNQDPWRLVILGNGPQREELFAEIILTHLQQDICLAGVYMVKDLPAYYALASAFIHPTLQDQWGLVVNEAMASSLPILVSNKAGCSMDLIQDGNEGFAFNPEDVADLGALMFKFSSRQVDLGKMRQAALRKIMSWGVERFARNLLQAVFIGVK